MKIRNGYVSNSSSSSFVIVGKITNNPLKSLSENKRVMIYVQSGGNSGDAEDFAMFIDNEIYEIINNSKWIKYHSEPIYFEVNKHVHLEDSDCLIVNKAVNDEQILFFNLDYSSPNNKEQLIKFLEDYK